MKLIIDTQTKINRRIVSVSGNGQTLTEMSALFLKALMGLGYSEQEIVDYFSKEGEVDD
jgi:Holliday junction resolvasome RuvABC DNA-binding subunit